MRTLPLSVLACASAMLCSAAPTQASTFLDHIKERVHERRAAQDPAAAAPDDATVAVASRQAPSLRDLAYGNDPRQRMDVYLPVQPLNAPVILMVHGGGWRHGDKSASVVVDNKVTRWVARGFVFISVNTRLLPQANPLEQARDVAQALAVAQAKAPSWGADPARCILMGHSAGAHLVALVNASPDLAAQAGAKAWLGTVALDSAAVDVAPIMQGSHFRLYDTAFGTAPAFWRAVSPIQQLTAVAKPMLAVCSTQRSDACAQADAFAARATELGVRAQVLRQDLSHRDINQTLGQPGVYTEAVEAFMRSLDPALAAHLSTP